MAKRTDPPRGWPVPSQVENVYSVAACVNDNFADYIDYWKHNCWWLFDSPEIIRNIAQANSIDLGPTRLFYYEAYELEFANNVWRPCSPCRVVSSQPKVVPPEAKQLEGFDVVTVWVENSCEPDSSPLASSMLAEELNANSHCLFDTFDQAYAAVEAGRFDGCEPGALRIFSVYSVDCPSL